MKHGRPKLFWTLDEVCAGLAIAREGLDTLLAAGTLRCVGWGRWRWVPVWWLHRYIRQRRREGGGDDE